MQHHPYPRLLVETELDEVIAGAERAEMDKVVRLLELRIFVGDPLEPRGERRPGLDDRRWRRSPRARIAPAHLHVAPVRHRALDRRADAFEIVRQIGGVERRARCHHAAADVDANRGRDHRALGRDHRTYGRADTDMHVRHGGDMLEHERHLCRARELIARLVVDRHAAGPHLDRHAALDVLVFVSRVGHCETSQENHHDAGDELRRDVSF